MFSLHERTQRRVCRTAFVLGCAVPTLITVCWVVYFHRPWQERDWQYALESDLHLQVQVEAVSAPRPNERLIQAVKLADLKTNKPLVEARMLSIGDDASLSVESITIYSGQFDQLATAIQVWLARDGFRPMHWRSKRLTLHATEGRTCEFENVQCETKVSVTGSRQCTIQTAHAGKRVQLFVEQSRDGNVRSRLDAQEAPLPAWLLTNVVPGGSRWRDSTFAGILALDMIDSSITGEFRGKFVSIDAQKWLNSAQLQTTADLHLEELRWRNGRVETIQGSLSAARGRISQALLLTLHTKLRCALAAELPDGSADQFHDFDQLGCRFELNAEGLTVSGAFACDVDQRALALAAGKPLIMQPAYSRLPLAFLVETVCGPAEYAIPATRAAADLAEKLPLPEQGAQKK